MSQIPPAGLRPLALATALLVSACASNAPAGPSEPDAPASLTVRTDSLQIDVDALRYHVAVGYPQLDGPPGGATRAAVDAANRSIRDSVEALVETYRPAEAVPADAPASEVTTVDGGYDDPFLAPGVFSALVEVYAYTGGAHGNTAYAPINVDLTTGAPVRLGALFRRDAAWADTLAARVGPALVAEAAARMEATEDEARGALYAEGYDAGAMRDATFTLGADSLALHFVPYEVAAYAFGTFRVPVAYTDLDAVLAPAGPAARLRARP